jgi:hypothetical protein
MHQEDIWRRAMERRGETDTERLIRLCIPKLRKILRAEVAHGNVPDMFFELIDQIKVKYGR